MRTLTEIFFPKRKAPSVVPQEKPAPAPVVPAEKPDVKSVMRELGRKGGKASAAARKKVKPSEALPVDQGANEPPKT